MLSLSFSHQLQRNAQCPDPPPWRLSGSEASEASEASIAYGQDQTWLGRGSCRSRYSVCVIWLGHFLVAAADARPFRLSAHSVQAIHPRRCRLGGGRRRSALRRRPTLCNTSTHTVALGGGHTPNRALVRLLD